MAMCLGFLTAWPMENRKQNQKDFPMVSLMAIQKDFPRDFRSVKHLGFLMVNRTGCPMDFRLDSLMVKGWAYLHLVKPMDYQMVIHLDWTMGLKTVFLHWV